MSKLFRMTVVVMAVMIQVVISVLYGFSSVPVSEVGCFIVWCMCALMVCHFVKMPKIV